MESKIVKTCFGLVITKESVSDMMFALLFPLQDKRAEIRISNNTLVNFILLWLLGMEKTQIRLGYSDEAVIGGKGEGFGDVLHVEFLENLAAVELYSVERAEHLPGYLLHGIALG